MKDTTAKKIVAVIERTGTGFSGYLKDVPGIAVVGESLSELQDNLIEALTLHIEALEEDGESVDHLKGVDIELKIDMEQLFEYYSMINKTAFAEFIGINKSLLRKYSKGLANPSEARVKAINEGLHKLGKELSSTTLV